MHLAIALSIVAIAYFMLFPKEQVTLARSLYENGLMPEGVSYYPASLDGNDVDVQYYENKTIITINKRLDPNTAMCTGSMHPYIGCGNMILTETLSAGDAVNIGDIVVYDYAGTKISHQVIGKDGDCYYLKGTNSAMQDSVCVKREDILARQVLVVPTHDYKG